jgi:hypothetical protein
LFKPGEADDVLAVVGVGVSDVVRVAGGLAARATAAGCARQTGWTQWKR